jgi:hypothetical protein
LEEQQAHPSSIIVLKALLPRKRKELTRNCKGKVLCGKRKMKETKMGRLIRVNNEMLSGSMLHVSHMIFLDSVSP